MKTTSTPAPSKSSRRTQLKAYRELHIPTVDHIYDLRSLARAALSLLDQIETQKKIVDDIEAARSVLMTLEGMALNLADDLDTTFFSIERGHHG